MKIFKNRLFIAVLCIITATISIFIGIKATENQNAEVEVIKVISNIRKGEMISKEMVTTKTVVTKDISKDFLRSPDDVIGKYALADLYPNDYILANKVSDKLPNAEEKLLKLDGSRVAISINLKDFSRGLSDKIISGDIVSCVITQEEGTSIPTELTYVEVLTTTMPSGIDKENSDDREDENLATATLLVTPEQARILADYDKKAEIHLALVYRGDEKTTKGFLDKQTDVLNQKSMEVK